MCSSVTSERMEDRGYIMNEFTVRRFQIEDAEEVAE